MDHSTTGHFDPTCRPRRAPADWDVNGVEGTIWASFGVYPYGWVGGCVFGQVGRRKYAMETLAGIRRPFELRHLTDALGLVVLNDENRISLLKTPWSMKFNGNLADV